MSSKCSGSSEQFKNGGGIDRISGLPDEILGHILSFLPTKHAVGSSILSRRWRYLYTLITNFDFDAEVMFHARVGKRPKRRSSFKDFVDRVLMLCRPTHIKKFRVKCHSGFDCSNVNAWINFALLGGVTELDVSTNMFFDSLVSPLSLFVCETLVVLRLHGNFEMKVPSNLLLPHLKSLELCYVSFSEENSLNELLSGCPMLEDLVLKGGRGDVETIKIFSSTVKRLTMDFLQMFRTYKRHRISVVFDLPNLLHCNYMDYLAENYCIKNLNSLEYARIDIVLDLNWDLFPESALGLITGVSSAKHLYFSGECMEKSDGADMLIGKSSCLSSCITHPTLEHLVFPEGLLIGEKDDDFDDQEFGSHLGEPPICLSSHLKTITIKPFHGFDEELRIAKYLIKHGKVLTKLILACLVSSKKGFRNLMKLSKMGRLATDECSIEFL